MKNSCISEATGLGTPETYTLLMHILTCFEVPINFYGAYCILLKTPEKMESVKWSMFIAHCFCAFDDFLISFVTVPYLYLPSLAGFPLGAIHYTAAETIIVIVFLGLTGVSLLALFENRYYILFGKHTFWQEARKPFLVLNYLLPPVMFFPMYFPLPDQTTAVSLIQERMPCNPATPRSFFVIATNPTAVLSVIGLLTLFISVELVTLASILIARMFLKQSSVTSRGTLDLQKKFVVALSIQTILPVTVLALPVFYMANIIYFNYYNQALNNLIFAILACHGSLSTIIMVFVHTPYRKVTLYPVYRLVGLWKERNPETAERTSSTVLEFR